MTIILPNEDLALASAIASAYSHLETLSPSEEDYQKTLNRISELYTLKYDAAKIRADVQQNDNQHQLAVDIAEHQLVLDARPFYTRVDPNTVLTVAGNLLIGLAVIKYEQTGVIRTQVLSFMKKF